MLRRKIYDTLLKWKRHHPPECLLITGARQVGKTFIVDQFGQTEYPHYLCINFMRDPAAKIAFENDLTVDSILLKLGAMYPQVPFVPHQTLIFLDEIQECARARTALKFFALDGRFDVIASGSILGIHLKQTDRDSVPVGYERKLHMQALDFEEYLWAVGLSQPTIDHVKEDIHRQRPLGEPFLSVFSEHFLHFMLVGGMPETVSLFLAHPDYRLAWQQNAKIMESYHDDIGRYLERPTARNRAMACFQSVSRQLARANRKFVYADIGEGSEDLENPTARPKNNAAKYEGSLVWLQEAEVIGLCHLVTEPTMPLEDAVDLRSFKAYYHDTGLLLSTYNIQVIRAVLLKEDPVYLGALTENLIAECLLRSDRELFYYAKKSRMELDFVTYLDAGIAAIEVKSGRNTTSRTLDRLARTYRFKRLIKLEPGDIRVDELGIEHYPLFAAGLLDAMDSTWSAEARECPPDA